MKQAKAIGMATVHQGSFADLEPLPGDVIYCDPPYEGTTEYKDGDFPHEQFWKIAQRWAESGAKVFVSEYNAPVGWEAIWEKPLRSGVSVKAAERHVALEKLFVWKGIK